MTANVLSKKSIADIVYETAMELEELDSNLEKRIRLITDLMTIVRLELERAKKLAGDDDVLITSFYNSSVGLENSLLYNKIL